MAITLPPTIEQLRRSIVPGPPLGLGAPQAQEAIAWGQADFDKPFEGLSAKDRVLLYAYWNQKRHIEELSEAFRQLFRDGRPTDPLIVIDLGCGPFTGGLALAGQLDPDCRFDYIGVDRSQTMCQLGERLAAEAERVGGLARVTRQWVADVSGIHWTLAPGWRPVVIIVSFLLASPSLDVALLVGELNLLLKRLGRGETTLIYTNSPKAGPNHSFPAFRDALVRIGFQLRADDIGGVETERRRLELRYALFHRGQQRTLALGGG